MEQTRLSGAVGTQTGYHSFHCRSFKPSIFPLALLSLSVFIPQLHWEFWTQGGLPSVSSSTNRIYHVFWYRHCCFYPRTLTPSFCTHDLSCSHHLHSLYLNFFSLFFFPQPSTEPERSVSSTSLRPRSRKRKRLKQLAVEGEMGSPYNIKRRSGEVSAISLSPNSFLDASRTPDKSDTSRELLECGRLVWGWNRQEW